MAGAVRCEGQGGEGGGGGVVVVVVAVGLGPGAHVEYGVGGAVGYDQVAVVAGGLQAQETFFFNGFDDFKGLAVHNHDSAVVGQCDAG